MNSEAPLSGFRGAFTTGPTPHHLADGIDIEFASPQTGVLPGRMKAIEPGIATYEI
jgi:hypothetical protein